MDDLLEMDLVMKARIESATQRIPVVRQDSGRPAGLPVVLQPAEPAAADLPEPYKKALVLWLQWNDAYEQATAKMFQSGQDQRTLEDMMDRMDQLRQDAVELSRDLIG